MRSSPHYRHLLNPLVLVNAGRHRLKRAGQELSRLPYVWIMLELTASVGLASVVAT